MSTVPDLWPEDITDEADFTTPITILRKQASALGTRTKNIVKGEVVTNEYAGALRIAFYLVAPVLGGYRYLLFTLYQPMEIYPLRLSTVNDDGSGNNVKIENQEDLILRLSEVLSSDSTKRIIRALIAQSTSEHEVARFKKPATPPPMA